MSKRECTCWRVPANQKDPDCPIHGESPPATDPEDVEEEAPKCPNCPAFMVRNETRYGDWKCASPDHPSNIKSFFYDSELEIIYGKPSPEPSPLPEVGDVVEPKTVAYRFTRGGDALEASIFDPTNATYPAAVNVQELCKREDALTLIHDLQAKVKHVKELHDIWVGHYDKVAADGRKLETENARLQAKLKNMTLYAHDMAEDGSHHEAEREGLREALVAIRVYGSDTLSGRTDGPTDIDWLREGIREMVRRARQALTGEQKDE